MTLNEACHKWVAEFNAIPCSLIGRAYEYDIGGLHELTPVLRNDNVYICGGKYDGKYGEIASVNIENNNARIYIDGTKRTISLDDIEVERDGWLPMWGTMWTFDDACDNWWLDDEANRQLMADCGFRIYESDELGYVFGIDGAGYDFYDAHWIPLYKARGLQWHDKEVA